jgi:hypothetical protein
MKLNSNGIIKALDKELPHFSLRLFKGREGKHILGIVVQFGNVRR